MFEVLERSLRVPGAEIYYPGRGSGPLVLILQSGDGDAKAANDIADELAATFTVVTYDRRGLSRSKADIAAAPATIESHSQYVRKAKHFSLFR
jgi:pimeloyl-ACP methyl ester carboxylesterase